MMVVTKDMEQGKAVEEAAGTPAVCRNTPQKQPNWPRRAWAFISDGWVNYRANLAARPLTMLLPPLFLLALCIGLGVYGVCAGAQNDEADSRTVLQGAGDSWGASFQLSIEAAFTPLVTMSIFIQVCAGRFTVFTACLDILATRLHACCMCWHAPCTGTIYRWHPGMRHRYHLFTSVPCIRLPPPPPTPTHSYITCRRTPTFRALLRALTESRSGCWPRCVCVCVCVCDCVCAHARMCM